MTRRSSSEWKEIPPSTPPVAQQRPGERERAVELLELVVDGDPQRLEGALGRVAAGEPRRRGDRRLDRVDQLLRRLDRRCARRRTIARAIAPAWRSSPNSRSRRASTARSATPVSIARAIVRRRDERELETTQELVDVIKGGGARARALPGGHPAKRSFQALRIAVNDELDQLDTRSSRLDGAAGGRRFGGISFHSLEDRRVKRFLVERARGCICPPDLPVCACGREPEAELINRRAIMPTPGEIADNPRSRSARLRAAKEIGSRRDLRRRDRRRPSRGRGRSARACARACRRPRGGAAGRPASPAPRLRSCARTPTAPRPRDARGARGGAPRAARPRHRRAAHPRTAVDRPHRMSAARLVRPGGTAQAQRRHRPRREQGANLERRNGELRAEISRLRLGASASRRWGRSSGRSCPTPGHVTYSRRARRGRAPPCQALRRTSRRGRAAAGAIADAGPSADQSGTARPPTSPRRAPSQTAATGRPVRAGGHPTPIDSGDNRPRRGAPRRPATLRGRRGRRRHPGVAGCR